MRNLMWLSMGLTILMIGCDSNNRDVNNTIPQTGKYDPKTAKKAGGPPSNDIPSGPPPGYGTDESSKKAADAAKEGESKDKAAPAPKDGDKAAPAPKDGDKATPKDGEKATPKEGDKAAKTDAKLSADEIAEINKLPDAKDRELALAQKVCPISGDNLGGMGAPLKVTADGKIAFLCCKGCKKDFDKDPQAALAKMGK